MSRKNTVRHKVRRKLKGASELCDNIQVHLAECAQPYEETHPEYYATFLEIGRIVETAKTLMVEFRKAI